MSEPSQAKTAPIRNVPSRSILRELPAISATDWENVRKVKRALRDLENGIFTSAAQVADAMGRDDRIEGVLMTRTLGLLGLPLEMEPMGDARRAKAVANEAREKWCQWFPEDQVDELLRWGLFVGVGLGQVLWSLKGSKWEPRLKVWHPQYLEFRWDTRTYWVSTDGGGNVEVLVGDPQWVLFTPYGYERGWMRGLVRSLAIPWLVRQWGWRDWARHSEIHGSPIKMGKVPTAASQEDKDRFVKEVAALGTESTVMVPQGSTKDEPGFDVELLEAAANTWEGFEKLLIRADTCIAVRVVGQNLTTEVKSGSLAAATIHDRVRNDILRADAGAVSTAFRAQALSAWARFNFGDAALAPYPKYDTEPPEDSEATGKAMKATGEGIAALRAQGVQVDVDAITEDQGIPTTGPAQEPPEPTEEEEREQAARRKRKKKDGLVRGQLYADELADRARQQGSKLVDVDLKQLLDVIEQATSYADLRQRLVDAYRDMDPTDLAALMRKSLIMASLNGRYAIAEDL